MDHSSSTHALYTDANLNYRPRRDSLAASVSTNSTASNLPGPGRTLGLGYDFVGKHIEIQLGRVAEKLGKGPRMTAVRIERRRSKAVSLPAGSRKLDSKNAKLEKDCMKLVKYVRSGVASTRMQALDQITRLAIKDRFVRDVLLVIGAVRTIEPLQRSDLYLSVLSPELMTSSRKALFSLVDTEVNAVAQEIRATIQSGCQLHQADKLQHMKSYLGDPDRAFLVIRHLDYFLMELCSRCGECAINLLDFITHFDKNSSRHIEWSTFDRLIKRYTAFITSPEANFQISSDLFLAPLLQLLLQFPEKLPQTIRSDFFSWFAGFDDSEYDIDIRHAQFTYFLLRDIALANGPDNEASFQNDLSLLQGLYPHPVVQPLLHRLTCPPEILLGQTVAIRHKSKCWNENAIPIVMEPEDLEHLCTQLSQYVDSEDERTCQRALRAFKYLLSIDLYCRRASLRALSATRFAQTSDFRLLVEESEKKCIPAVHPYSFHTITRHCTNSGDLLHIFDSYGVCCDVLEGTKQILEFSKQDVLELHIPRGTSFSTAGHLPLLAGVTAMGEKAYIALPVSRSGQSGNYIAVTEGTKPEDLRMWEDEWDPRKKAVPLYLVVYVLRYPPDTYMRCERFANDEAGLDATGPYSWKPVQPCSWDSCQATRLMAILEEEEMSGSIDLCGDGQSTVEEWESANEWESVDITFE